MLYRRNHTGYNLSDWVLSLRNMCASIFLFYPHLRTLFHCFLEREERGMEGGRGRQGGREKRWLPPVCALMGNRTCNLLVHGMMLQPTEPPGQGCVPVLFDFQVLGYSPPQRISSGKEFLGTVPSWINRQCSVWLSAHRSLYHYQPGWRSTEKGRRDEVMVVYTRGAAARCAQSHITVVFVNKKLLKRRGGKWVSDRIKELGTTC